jgi:hypothetical protein
LKIIFIPCRFSLKPSLLLTSVFAETVKAVNRAVTARLERDLCLNAAAGTDRRVHFTRGTGAPASVFSLLAGCPALWAAAGLVGKALLSVELLLGSSKFKIGATITAIQGFVLIHRISSSKLVCSHRTSLLSLKYILPLLQ